MTKYIFEPNIPAAIIKDSNELFPIHRVFCVGRNYAEHAIEMGHDHREPPFFFMKPAHAINHSKKHPYPVATKNYHFEMELVVAIGSSGKDISVSSALDFVFGYACGIDFTRRDLQQEAKNKGRPWEAGKALDHSGPISEIVQLPKDFPIKDQMIRLEVNGEEKQNSTVDNMIWSVEEVISHLSSYFELQKGDLIFTGTPAGVGPVIIGDKVFGEVSGVGSIELEIV